MAYQYNPESEVPAEFWLSLDESERIRMAEDCHRRAGIKLPNRRINAALHAIVETQIAMGEETEAQATLTRLLSEGLDRHDAIHAIGDVLAEHMQPRDCFFITEAEPTAHFFDGQRPLIRFAGVVACGAR